MNISKAIKIAMVHKGINQKELAEMSDINVATLSHTLSGKSKPNAKRYLE